MHRPTWVEISGSALAHNLAVVRSHAKGAGVCAAVKAEAYGHGLVEVGRFLASQGVECLAVALVEEGVLLREAGVRVPVLVMGGGFAHNAYAVALDYGLTLAVSCVEHVEGLAQAACGRKAVCHIETDTGMARLGAPLERLPAVVAACVAQGVEIEGVYTHLACADSVAGAASVSVQKTLFEGVRAVLGAQGVAPKWVHIANSAGLLGYGFGDANTVRPGLMLYGIDPLETGVFRDVLKPVLRWCTKPVLVRDIPEGTPVSYGGRWKAPRASRLATLPVGYADGYRRMYGQRGAYVLVEGRRAPVVGTVCMDLCMVDVTDIPGVSCASEVVLLGEQGADKVSVYEMALWGDTIPYEVTCAIGGRVPRMWVS